jgi:YggT family protein
MQQIMGFLASLLGLYSLLLIIRIVLTWFESTRYSRPVLLLARVTDPYLDWWRQKLNLRVGILDLSPLAAMAALSVAQTICSAIARQGRISLAVILYVCLSAIWSAASFILGFCIIILLIRLFAYFANVNMYSPFWQVVDSISRPLLYRIGRIIFGKRIVGYMTSILVSAAALGGIWLLGRFAVRFLAGLLLKPPL